MRHSNRSNMTKGDFANWVDQRERGENGDEESASSSFLPSLASLNPMASIGAIQENFSNQLQELSGSLPEAGPLSAAFRQRATYAIYLLLASIAFGLLAVFVGLPTLLFRPAKFVLCKGFIT